MLPDGAWIIQVLEAPNFKMMAAVCDACSLLEDWNMYLFPKTRRGL